MAVGPPAAARQLRRGACVHASPRPERLCGSTATGRRRPCARVACGRGARGRSAGRRRRCPRSADGCVPSNAEVCSRAERAWPPRRAEGSSPARWRARAARPCEAPPRRRVAAAARGARGAAAARRRGRRPSLPTRSRGTAPAGPSAAWCPRWRSGWARTATRRPSRCWAPRAQSARRRSTLSPSTRTSSRCGPRRTRRAAPSAPPPLALRREGHRERRLTQPRWWDRVRGLGGVGWGATAGGTKLATTAEGSGLDVGSTRWQSRGAVLGGRVCVGMGRMRRPRPVASASAGPREACVLAV